MTDTPKAIKDLQLKLWLSKSPGERLHQLMKDNEEIFTFGKHKGAKVDKILESEPGYFSWIQNADFPLYTKKVLTAIKLRKLNTK